MSPSENVSVLVTDVSASAGLCFLDRTFPLATCTHLVFSSASNVFILCYHLGLRALNCPGFQTNSTEYKMPTCTVIRWLAGSDSCESFRSNAAVPGNRFQHTWLWKPRLLVLIYTHPHEKLPIHNETLWSRHMTGETTTTKNEVSRIYRCRM